jgi:hypothetical protein
MAAATDDAPKVEVPGTPSAPALPADPPVAPAAPAPAPAPAPAGPALTTAVSNGSSSGGGNAHDQLAVIDASLREALGRAWSRLSIDIAAQVISGADAPAAHPD